MTTIITIVKTFFTLLAYAPNLWFLIKQAPTAIAVIRMIITAVGSETFQHILEVVADFVQGEKALPKDADPVEKQRLLRRIKERLGVKLLGLNETDYQVLCSVQENRSRWQTSDIPSVHGNSRGEGLGIGD